MAGVSRREAPRSWPAARGRRSSGGGGAADSARIAGGRDAASAPAVRRDAGSIQLAGRPGTRGLGRGQGGSPKKALQKRAALNMRDIWRKIKKTRVRNTVQSKRAARPRWASDSEMEIKCKMIAIQMRPNRAALSPRDKAVTIDGQNHIQLRQSKTN